MGNPQRERLRIATKVAFGIGSGAEVAVTVGFNYWNFLFYNQVLGLSGKLCGLAVTISLVLDALLDPVVGFMSDRWHSKLGRRHPFLYLAPLPLALSFFCIYVPPAGLSGLSLFLWFVGFTTLFRQSLTLFTVPHLALGAELSTDYRERSVVMSYAAIFGILGGAGTFFFGWTWLKQHGGTTVREAYVGLAACVAVFSALVIFLSAHLTRDRIPFMTQVPANQRRMNVGELLQETWACFRNRNYVWLVLGLVFVSITVGTRESLDSYMALFYWAFPEDKIRLFGLASPPGFLIAFLITARLHARFDKRTTIIGAVVFTVMAGVAPVLLRMLGVMPPNGAPTLLPVRALFVFLQYGSSAVLTISVLSALADVADEHELATGRRQEGVFYAARIFLAKLSAGLGVVFAGFAVDAIHFPKGAKAGQIGAKVLWELGVVEGLIAAIPAVISIYFYSRYHISRERHAEIQRELAALRAKPSPVLDSVPPIAAEPALAAPAG